MIHALQGRLSTRSRKVIHALQGRRSTRCSSSAAPQNEFAYKRTHRGGDAVDELLWMECGLRVRATAGIKNGTWRVRRETADSTPPSRTRSARRPSPAPRNQGVIRQRCIFPISSNGSAGGGDSEGARTRWGNAWLQGASGSGLVRRACFGCAGKRVSTAPAALHASSPAMRRLSHLVRPECSGAIRRG